MAATADTAKVLRFASEIGFPDLRIVPSIEADSHAGAKNEAAVDKFLKNLDFIRQSPPPRHSKIPSIFLPPSNLSSAFGRIIDETSFRDRLEEFADVVGRTSEAETYLVRWNLFMGDFIERAFVVRAMLEAALASDDLVFDNAAATQMRRMEKMKDWAGLAFQERIKGPVRKSWAFNFVWMQLERINQTMNAINYYPRLLENPNTTPEKIKRWRATMAGELKRLSDPLTYLSGVDNFKGLDHLPKTSLKIDLPKGTIDLFTAHPEQDRIDFEAVRNNARSFAYLRSALEEIAIEAGRDHKSREIKIRYSPSMGSFIIEDKNPMVDGALYPFGTEPPQSRLYSLVDRMGPGSFMDMKGASFKVGGMTLRHSVAFIVIQLADELVPNRKITFPDAASAKVAQRIKSRGGEAVQKKADPEDSDITPMKSVFEERPSYSGVMHPVPEEAPTHSLQDMFADIADEVEEELAAERATKSAVEAAATQASNAAAVSAFEIVRPVLLRG